MRSYFLINILILLCLFSCTKKPDSAEEKLNGKYSGVFVRDAEFSHVKFIFLDGEYLGQSEFIKFPFVCSEGSYTIEADSIYFSNTCIATADFDHTLKLAGKWWKFELSGTYLSLNNQYGDEYRLTKQPNR